MQKALQHSTSPGGGGERQDSQGDIQRELLQTMEFCIAGDQVAMTEGLQLEIPLKKSFLN